MNLLRQSAIGALPFFAEMKKQRKDKLKSCGERGRDRVLSRSGAPSPISAMQGAECALEDA